MSALPPKADMFEAVEKSLLMTQSGHSLDCPTQSEANLPAYDCHMCSWIIRFIEIQIFEKYIPTFPR